jgi:hypothetical protein
MLTDNIKIIEENAISMLRMIHKQERESFDDIKDYLSEIFMAQRTALSEPALKQMTRFVMNLVKGYDITRQNADSVILTTLSNVGMKALVEEYKETIK